MVGPIAGFPVAPVTGIGGLREVSSLADGLTIMVGGSASVEWCMGMVLLVVGVVVWVCFGVRTGVFGVVLGVRRGVLGG